MFFVILIYPNGTPGSLIGPMEEFEECVHYIIDKLINDPDLEAEQIPDFDTIYIDEHFEYPDDEGGGFYILRPQSK